MAPAKLFGCEAEAEDCGGAAGSSIAGEVSRSGIQPDGEAMSLSVCFPPSNQREIGDRTSYIRFSGSNPDSGSVSMDSEPKSIFDFFNRDSYEVDTVGESFYVSPNRRVSTRDDFNIFGVDDTEEIELGLGIGSGSSGSRFGLLRCDSGGVGLEVTGNDEIDSSTSLDPVGEEAMVADEELEWENLQNAISWVQEGDLVLASRDDDQEDQLDLHWQFLSSVYDVEDIMAGYDLRDIEHGENHGDYNYNAVFDNEAGGIMGSPPASKRVVDDLPDVEITSEELSNGNIVCAICKDEIVVDEKVKGLPCRHCYHGECIIPWLGIRNTCPVCRYELPTDNLEYERNRRSQRH